MKTFDNFLKEQQAVEEEGLNKFLSQHGLDSDWLEYKNKPKPVVAPPSEAKGWKLGPEEGIRDLNRIVGNIIRETKIVNNFCIENVKFELISKQEVSTGYQCPLEVTGKAKSRDENHLKNQLSQLINKCKKPLLEKNIYLVDKIDKLNISQNESINEPAVGLVHAFKFNCIMQAIFKKGKL